MNNFKLKKLTLNNFATFKNEQVTFNNNFNAIIGETGSGKSIILDAIQLIFGQRADKKLIRKNSDFCSVEGVFKCLGAENKSYFFEMGYPYEDEIIVKRIIYKSGKSKSFLNHQSCPLSTLVEFSKKFIDLVGQFENQKLLSREYQMQLLDSFGGTSPFVSSYSKMWSQYGLKLKRLEEVKRQIEEEEQKKDFLNFQIQEIKSLDPSVEDEQELIKLKDDCLANENRKNALNECLSKISEDENCNILGELQDCLKILNSLNNSTEIVNHLNDCFTSLEEVSFTLSSEISQSEEEIELDPILDRLDNYQKLKRKFNSDTHGLVLKKESFERELNDIHGLKKEFKEISEEIQIIHKSLMELAKEIHEKRTIHAKELSKKLTKEIQNLKMEGASVNISISKNKTLNESGISNLIFNVETNPGEGYYEIKEVASGGELSRILLALRTILSNSDSISIFFFDEIDAGIGGETALFIGKALLKVAQHSQVIAITHLPQIANFANKLIHVSKISEKDPSSSVRTISHIQEITGKGKVEYIQAMNPLH